MTTARTYGLRTRLWTAAWASALGLIPMTTLSARQDAPAKAENKADKKKTDEKKAEDKKDDDEKDKTEDEKKKETFPAPLTAETTHNLAECLSIAMSKHPAIRAATASLRAAEVGRASLGNLSTLAVRLTPDLGFRQQQADRGVVLAQAEVIKVLSEVQYDTTRLYYSFVYARQQEQTATEIIDQMQVFYDIAEELVKTGANKDVNQYSLFRMEDAIAEVKKPRITARNGQERALASLKQSMGLEQSYIFLPRDVELPLMAGTVTSDQVISLAVSRRPEMAQAAAGVDAFRLEVCAQGAVQRRQKVPTLASGSDLHSRAVPQPVRNGEYRPGALAPEMPPTLLGRREDRVARATALSEKQDAVYDVTRELVTLEAMNTFLNWQAATERVKLAKSRFDNAMKMQKLSRENASNLLKYDVLILNEALAAKAQAEYLEAVFEQLKSLATLDRVTVGGVKPDFPNR